MKASGEQIARNQCDVYLVHQGEQAQMQAFVLAERLRDAGLDVILHCAAAAGAGSFKSQMKRADGSGAAFAVIIGEDEVAAGKVAIKAMRAEEEQNKQVTVAFMEAVDHIVGEIVGAGEHDHDHEHIHYHH
jgi:histidyl-tRNA synthetase